MSTHLSQEGLRHNLLFNTKGASTTYIPWAHSSNIKSCRNLGTLRKSIATLTLDTLVSTSRGGFTISWEKSETSTNEMPYVFAISGVSWRGGFHSSREGSAQNKPCLSYRHVQKQVRPLARDTWDNENVSSTRGSESLLRRFFTLHWWKQWIMAQNFSPIKDNKVMCIIIKQQRAIKTTQNKILFIS